MKNKKAVMQDYVFWIIITLVVIVIAGLILAHENSFLSGFISNIKNKLRFGF